MPLSVLVALPMAHALQVLWRSFLSLPPSLPWPCHMSPVPLLPRYLPPLPLVYVSLHSCFLLFHFGPGMACLPHLTTRLAAQKIMMNHIPPTRCLKTKINTNANFHTPNHAVQHGAGFTRTCWRHDRKKESASPKFWQVSQALLLWLGLPPLLMALMVDRPGK